ncbi:putative ribonuclease H-like domain-containing protein [Tanacetum coccineum]
MEQCLEVNTAKQSSPRAAVSNSTTRYVNTAASRPTVNGAKPSLNVFHKLHSSVKRTFYQRTAPKNNDFKEKVNTAKDQGIFDSGCSRHMTGNKFYLSDYQDFEGGFVAFKGSSKGGKITRKGKIRTDKLDFEDVYFVKELKFNLFSVSQMCDKKNSVLFTETECLVLSPDFKLLDESQVLLKIPRQNNMYSFDLKNVVPSGGLTCLFAKATIDESNLWHRRLGHINFKTMNKLVRGNLVRGLPSKIFENDHTCVACQKGKQHKASCKTKLVSSISQPLQMLHMDLFGPTFVKSLNKKMYCLVVTDDFSRFSWVFFLASKDETRGILGNGYQQKGQKRSQNGQNRARNGKSEKKSRSKPKNQPKSQPRKVKVKTEADIEEMLNGPTLLLVEANQGLGFHDLENKMIQGLGFVQRSTSKGFEGFSHTKKAQKGRRQEDQDPFSSAINRTLACRQSSFELICPVLSKGFKVESVENVNGFVSLLYQFYALLWSSQFFQPPKGCM